MTNNLMSHGTIAYCARGEAISTRRRPSITFENLSMDVLYNIVSKLPSKEFARTRILSTRWRCMWSTCPRLTFDGVEVCKCDRVDLHHHIKNFIHEVNTVLQKHQGQLVETLEIRIDFVDSLLIHNLNNWVSFAVSSNTKNLTLDLKPERFWEYKDRFVFPFDLLDNKSTSRLQHLQLSFVSLNLPSHFRGFPNLRKLHIQTVQVSRNDLEHVLGCCSNLEWLRIDRCNLNNELIVGGTLPRLLYLYVEHCKLTKIKFDAPNLATFKYEGAFIPTDLTGSCKLQNAYIRLSKAVFQQAFISLLHGLPDIQNLTLRIGWQHIEKQWSWHNQLKFSHLRHLQLFVFAYPEDVDMILYLVSFLRVTPFIKKLEIHFTGHYLWLADVGPRRQELRQCIYHYLTEVHISGFKGARGQLEFLLHAVENAPALEVVSVNTSQEASKEIWPYGGSGPPFEEAKRIAITSLSTTLSQNVKYYVF